MLRSYLLPMAVTLSLATPVFAVAATGPSSTPGTSGSQGAAAGNDQANSQAEAPKGTSE